MDENRYVSTALVATALGVSVSTVKRWVDEGYLPAHKTAGGHRKILLGDVLRLVHSRNLPHVNLQLLAEARKAAPLDFETLARQVQDSLRLGDATKSLALLLDAYQSGRTIAELGDLVVAPAMEAIGRDWETGQCDVLHEHRGTQTCLAALHGLQQAIEPANDSTRPRAVGGCVEGDHYQIPSLLVQLTLQDLGWEAINIGPNLPIASFRRALSELRPALLWMSFSHLADRERLKAEYVELSRAARRQKTMVALGGQALSPELRARLPADLHAAHLAQLVELASQRYARRGTRQRSKDDANVS